MTPLKQNQMRGFTLIETIVYLALFGILMAGLIISAFYLIDSGAKNQKLVATQEEGTFLVRKLSWAAGSATDADTFGPETLRLTRTDLPAAENPLTVTLVDGVMMLERGSEGPLPLSASEFPVSNLVFSVIHESGRPTYVKATFNVGDRAFQLDTYLRE